MEVFLSAEKEAQLHQLASKEGRSASQLLEEAIDRMLEYDLHFVAAVEQGRASVRRGALVDHSLVVEQIEKLLVS